MVETQKGQTVYDIREVYDDETGVLRVRQITRSGLLCSPPNDQPSHAVFDEQGRPFLFEWHHAGTEHREEGPSKIWFTSSGVHEVEIFNRHGEPRSGADGPHIVRRDPRTGEITEVSDDSDWRGRMPYTIPQP